jgi:tetratricopeptide (TPR) repeat protein
VALLITGEAGVGKSALVRRFAHDVRGTGVHVFAGRCDAQESVPFRAFDGIADAMTRWLLTVPAERRDALLPADAALLSRMFRVFERLVPADAVVEESGLDVRARRRRAFAVLRELLGNVGRAGPTVLVIDDLQWIDADSVQLLEAVFALRPPPVLLIGLVVPTPHKPAPLRAALASVDIEVRELALGGLDPDASTELARVLVPDADGETVAQVASAGGGSPLFLEQVAASVAGGRPVPPSLEAVLWDRLSELDDAARGVLDVVCIAGLPIDLATVARATGLARQELAAALARLEALRLVRTTGARRADSVEPYHDTVRQAVRATLTPEQARHRHLVVAEALEKRAAAPWLVFHHLLAAGEPARAAPFAVEAAVRARRELSARRVARLCHVALELLPEGDAARGELCRAYAVALGNAGQGGEAARWYLEAARLTSGVDAIELRRRAADHLLRCGRIDDGMAVVREVLGDVGVTLPSGGIDTVTSLMWRRARVRLRALREAGGAARDPAVMLRADVCLSFGMSLGLIDTLAGASLHALGALDAMRLGEPDRLARALAAEAGYVAIAGTRGAARAARLLDEAEAHARRAVTPVPSEIVRWVRGLTLFLQGRYPEALEALDAAARGFAERCPGLIWEQTSAELFAAWALSHLGRLEELERRLGELRRASHWHDDRYTAALARTGNCVLPLLAADRVRDAQLQVDLAMSQWSQSGFHMQHMMELLARIEIDLYAGDAAAAAARLAAASAPIDRALILRIQHTRLVHLDLRARVALASGDRARLSGVTQLARLALREGAAWARGPAHARLAAVAAAEGRPQAALEQLERAADELDTSGVTLVAAAVRLRAVAVRGEPLGSSEPWAALVAAGVRRPDRWMAMYAPWLA